MRHLQIYRFIAGVARCGSIRKAADQLHITPSALTRKLQDFEEELGTSVFERLPHGMRLTAAGELLVRHIRDQVADFDRLRTELDELAGLRRGHVSMACAQAFVERVMPEQIAAYRARYPQVTFSLEVRDNLMGIAALTSYDADLALLVDPPSSAEVVELLVKRQPLCAVMGREHPLAKLPSVRLRECLTYPVALPAPSLAIRTLLDVAIYRSRLAYQIAVESGSLEFLRGFVIREPAVTFQPLTGVPEADARLCARPIDTGDLDPIRVVLAKLKGRSLSIPAEQFAEQLRAGLLDLA